MADFLVNPQKYGQGQDTVVGHVITTFQKISFVVYFALNLYMGTLFSFANEMLMPEEPSTLSWFNNFFYDSDAKREYYRGSCDSIYTVTTNIRCLRTELLRSDDEVYAAAIELFDVKQLQFLVTLRTIKFLTPLLMQLSLVFVPILSLFALFVLLMKILEFCGLGDRFKSLQQVMDRLAKKTDFKTLRNVQFIVVGVLIICMAACVFSSSSPYEVTHQCKASLCLYCLPRLMHTVFKDRTNATIYSSLTVSSIISLSVAKLMTVSFLMCTLYLVSISLVNLSVYVVFDAYCSILETLKKTIKSAVWNKIKSMFKIF